MTSLKYDWQQSTVMVFVKPPKRGFCSFHFTRGAVPSAVPAVMLSAHRLCPVAFARLCIRRSGILRKQETCCLSADHKAGRLGA